MKKAYTFFIIGILTAIPIPIIDNLDELDELEELKEFGEHPVESYMHFVKTGAKIWEFGYLIILAITLPIKIIPSFQTRIPPRSLLMLNFVSGQSFGFIMIKIISFPS